MPETHLGYVTYGRLKTLLDEQDSAIGRLRAEVQTLEALVERLDHRVLRLEGLVERGFDMDAPRDICEVCGGQHGSGPCH